MAKRFTETDLWKNQRWFRKLIPEYKLAFGYIKDLCNHSGFWKIDCIDLIEDLGIESFTIEDFVTSVNTEYDPLSGSKTKKERLRLVKKNYLWITGFIQFQYEGKDKKVNPAAAPVRTALLFLQSLNLLEDAVSKGYITLTQPLQEGWQTPKDKDRDKDKKGGVGENKKGAIKISDGFAYFEDGSKQELGDSQKFMSEQNQLKARDVKKGVSY